MALLEMCMYPNSEVLIIHLKWRVNPVGTFQKFKCSQCQNVEKYWVEDLLIVFALYQTLTMVIIVYSQLSN